MRARYYISFNGTDYSEFFPSNSPIISWAKEGDEIFRRPKVDRFKIARSKNIIIYDHLYNRFYDPIYFGENIYYKINVLGADKFFFISPINKGQIDAEKNVYEVTPDPNDSYRTLLLNYETKYQDRNSGWIFGNWDPIYIGQNVNTTTFANIDFTGWTDTAGAGYMNNSVGWANNGAGTVRARNTITGALPQDIVLKVTAFSGTAVVMRGVDGGGTPVGADVTINGIGTYVIDVTGATYLEVYNTSLVLVSGSFTYSLFTTTTAGGDHYYGCLLEDAINSALGASYINSGLTAKSTILWNDALPTDSVTDTPNIDAYITANPTYDYVREAEAIFNHIWIVRTDNITDDEQDYIETSLKDIMDMLRQKFNLYWFIDKDGFFRIEHLKYFKDFASQEDLTTAHAEKPEVDVRIYKYEVGQVYKQTTFSENNQSNEDWIPYPINYTQSISNAVHSVSVSSLTTDIKYVKDDADADTGKAQNNGFCLIKAIQGINDDYIASIDQSNVTATAWYLNANFGWSYVLYYYHSYDASAEAGTVNGSAYTFEGVKEYLKQTGIKFLMTNDLDWKKPFTLTEGLGWIDNAEYNPETGMYRIDVGLNPYSVTIYIVDSTDITTQIVSDGGEYLTR